MTACGYCADSRDCCLEQGIWQPDWPVSESLSDSIVNKSTSRRRSNGTFGFQVVFRLCREVLLAGALRGEQHADGPGPAMAADGTAGDGPVHAFEGMHAPDRKSVV